MVKEITREFDSYEQVKSLKDRINYNKNLIFKILEKNKVKNVVIYFEGSNDSGQVNDVTIKPDSKKGILNEPFSGALILSHTEYKDDKSTSIYYKDDHPEMNLEFVLNSFCYDILELRHCGWEINDGSFGEFVFDVKNHKVNLVFNERYMEINTTEDSY